MKLVTRYLLREHVGPLVFAVTTLTSLLLLSYISKRFQDLVGKGLPWGVIAEFFLLSVPFTVAMTLPMAVLIATLYAFSRLAGDSEITALMANGIGTRRLLTPVLGAGLVLSAVMFVFNDQLLPRANHELNGLSASIAQKKPTLALKPQILNHVSRRSLYMWMSQLDRSTNAMRNVTIYDGSDPRLRRTIIADSGSLEFAPNGHDLLLILHSGYVLETHSSTPDRFQRMYFKTDIVKVADVANDLKQSDENAYKGDREMTVCELDSALRRVQHLRDSVLRKLAATNAAAAAKFPASYGSRLGTWYCSAVGSLGPKQAVAQTVRSPGSQQPAPPISVPRPGAPSAGRDPAAIPVQTTVLALDVESAERSINRYDVEIQKKFAISIACLVFALLGPPIALRFPRAGVGLTIGVSLGVFALYYIGLIAGEKLSDNLKVAPWVAMWAANVVLGAAGLGLSVRMAYHGAAARTSGGFSDVLDRVLPWRRRRVAS